MGSATSADAKKKKKKLERIQRKKEKIEKQKQQKREQIFENHEDYDEDGNPFFYDEYGKQYYLDDDFIPYYLDEKRCPYYYDRNSHKFYLDDKGKPYHVDDHGDRCHWDNMGNPFYISDEGEPYYLDHDRLKYFLDEEGLPFYFDDKNNKIWIRFDCLDKNGRVISRTKSRKTMKDLERTDKEVTDTTDEGIGETTLDNVNSLQENQRYSKYTQISDKKDNLTKKPSNMSELSLAPRQKIQSTAKASSFYRQSRETKISGIASSVPPGTTTTESEQTDIVDPTLTPSSTASSQETDFNLSCVKTLTPDIDKYLDTDQNTTVNLEDLTKAKQEVEKRILSKILQAEKEKGFLPPRKLFRKIGHYSVRQRTDKKDCSITGSAFLPNGNLVVSDFHNRNLKMFDPDMKFIQDLNLDAYPENMCARAQDFDVYVSFKAGMQHGIKVVKVTNDSMSLVRTLKTIGLCYGICSNNGGLAVIVNNVHGWQIHLLDLNGFVKKQLTIELDDNPLLKRPDYLSVTRDLRLLISDREANGVFCFDIWTEKLFFEYKAIREPYGVACDNKGSIFVTSPGGVHQISTSGERIGTLMSRDEIGFSPTCACFDEDDAMLVLTGQSNDMVAFQLMDVQTRDHKDI